MFLHFAAYWGQWNAYGECSVTCGDGTQTRTRSCIDPSTSDTVACSDLDWDMEESTECNDGECPTASWGDWGPWSGCTASCGGGTRTREQLCNDSDPTDDNIECTGDPATGEEVCNTGLCRKCF